MKIEISENFSTQKLQEDECPIQGTYQGQFEREWHCLRNHRSLELDPFFGNSCSQHNHSDFLQCWVGNRHHFEGQGYSQLQLHKHNPVPSEGLDHPTHLCISNMQHLQEKIKIRNENRKDQLVHTKLPPPKKYEKENQKQIFCTRN